EHEPNAIGVGGDRLREGGEELVEIGAPRVRLQRRGEARRAQRRVDRARVVGRRRERQGGVISIVADDEGGAAARRRRRRRTGGRWARRRWCRRGGRLRAAQGGDPDAREAGELSCRVALQIGLELIGIGAAPDRLPEGDLARRRAAGGRRRRRG